ncbi:hypothetical protein T4D_13462 [Trichinella pseudospiralis]|uniref:Uncharacterized protein n=1 Tax=Trichinella pseudospiralis TaxID=6337 RepID=A0A0V1FDG8_TRIPS|nr:hypothetical protein T4D_13462 [Trichinella pseudospiralis]
MLFIKSAEWFNEIMDNLISALNSFFWCTVLDTGFKRTTDLISSRNLEQINEFRLLFDQACPVATI